jgi:TatD DNase family protein
MHDLIDIGANLTHDSFDKDRDDVLRRARDAGVSRQVVTGTTLEASRDAVALANKHPGTLFATAGIHPHHAQELDDDTLKALHELAQKQAVVAVGECGLDYFRNYSPREAQLAAFEKQLNLAIEVQKPIFLHQRDAHDEFASILGNDISRIPGGVAHCFTGTRDEMRACLDMGLYIGITGWICDERRGHDLQEAARYLPLDRIMLETDAPYLVPRDLKDKPDGRRNEPSVLPHILESVARYLNQPAQLVAEAATRNAETLFRLSVN